MAENNELTVGVENTRIVEIRQTKLVFDSNLSQTNEDSELTLSVKVEQSVGVAKDTNRLSVRTNVLFNNSLNNNIEVEYRNEIIFEVSYLDDVVQRNGETLIVNIHLKRFLYAICLSTSRGLLAEKLANTPYAVVFLPILEMQLATITE